MDNFISYRGKKVSIISDDDIKNLQTTYLI